MVMLLTFAASVDVEAPTFFAANDELRAYLLEAAENDAGLKARHSEWKAALERVPQVTSLDDPMFMYTQFVQSDGKRFAVSLEQKFPWFGTLRAKGDKALAEADAALARFYAARNGAFATVKEAYFEYALLGENIRIVESQVGLLADTEADIRSQYALGLGAESDVYRIQIEQEKTGDQLKGLTQSRSALAARLNETLGRQSNEEPPWPQPAQFPPPPPPAQIVLAQIRAQNPDLAAMRHMIEGWENATRVAKKMGYPEFSVGVEYGDMKTVSTSMPPAAPAADPLEQLNSFIADSSEGPKDDVMISLKLSLPIWRGKVKAGIREAEHMQEAAADDKRRAELALDSAARKLLFQIEDALRRYHLYKDTLAPKQKQTYVSLQAAYATGDYMNTATGFIDVMDSIRALLEFQLEQARAARDVQVACAELEMLMGRPWTSQFVKPRQTVNETEPSTPAGKDPAVRTVESQTPPPTETKP